MELDTSRMGYNEKQMGIVLCAVNPLQAVEITVRSESKGRYIGKCQYEQKSLHSKSGGVHPFVRIHSKKMNGLSQTFLLTYNSGLLCRHGGHVINV